MGRVLLEDTRQQAQKHERKHDWWSKHNYTLVRSKLAFGDYCLPPKVAVDTKASIIELAYDIDQEHERFRRELVAARDAGTHLVILVENTEGIHSLSELAGWMESTASFAKRFRAKRRLCGARLAKACKTLSDRYGARFMFCAPEATAEYICSILAGSDLP